MGKTAASLAILVILTALVMGCVQEPGQPGQAGQWEISGSSGQKYGIFLMDSDGGNVREIYGSSRSVSDASVSPDGKSIVFYEQEGGIEAGLETITTSEIALVGTDGTGYSKLTDNGWMDFQPRWSPDGREILFISEGGKQAGTDIYVMDKEGSVLRQLTDTPGISEADPDWKCGKVVFTREHSVWIMDINGSNEMRLTDPEGKGQDIGVQFPMGDYDPSLSPDCARVVFERLTGPGQESGGVRIGDYDLYVHDIATGEGDDISNNEGADFVPEWSGDGILFIHISDSPQDAYDVYRTNPDGSGRLKVTGNDPPGFLEKGVSWFGDSILFTAETYG